MSTNRSRHAPLAMDSETFRTIGRQLVDRIADRLAASPGGPVTRDDSPAGVRNATVLLAVALGVAPLFPRRNKLSGFIRCSTVRFSGFAAAITAAAFVPGGGGAAGPVPESCWTGCTTRCVDTCVTSTGGVADTTTEVLLFVGITTGFGEGMA